MTAALSPRLQLKRVFRRYYLQVCGDGIPDPSDAYIACLDYLDWRCEVLGRRLTDDELAEEMERLGGELEQDLMRRGDEYKRLVVEEPLLNRLSECMVVARGREADRPS